MTSELTRHTLEVGSRRRRSELLLPSSSEAAQAVRRDSSCAQRHFPPKVRSRRFAPAARREKPRYNDPRAATRSEADAGRRAQPLREGRIGAGGRSRTRKAPSAIEAGPTASWSDRD